jgi:cell division protein FtsZ
MNMIKFDLPKNQSSIIKVIGVGGGGSNAVTHMFKQGINGVDFVITNTDIQALEKSPVPNKVQLGANLTDGMGAGSIPEVGREAAKENIEEIKSMLQNNTKMVFITAGMGGGTGTGAAPVIASIAKEMGILTVGIVTVPFNFEGRKRREQADAGIQELRKNVDTLLIICNDKLRELCGDLKLSEAFSKADNILSVAAKGIAEIITVTGNINVDFKDVNTVMRNSGVAIMGTGVAEGEERAIKAVEQALTSPLLNDSNIKGAKNILLYIASGANEVTMDEVTEITDYIQTESGSTAEIIWGTGNDETLENLISVTIIATGFNSTIAGEISNENYATSAQRKVVNLHEEEVKQEKVEKVDLEDFKIVKRDVFENQSYTPKETFEPKNIIQSQSIPENTPLDEFTVRVIDNESINDVSSNSNYNEEIEEIVTFKMPNSLMSDDTVSEKKGEPVQENYSYGNNNSFVEDDNKAYEKSLEENIKLRHHERMSKLRDMSLKIRTASGLAEIESEPAYLRKNVVLSNVTHSSETDISKYSLGQDDENKSELKSNSYLHDNVD